MPKRRSTVHDLASLRLHPDGTKVSSTEINVQLKKGRYATRDHRGNWIAHDAGGVGRVKIRRAAVKEPEEAHEHELDEDEELEAGPSRLSVEKGKGRADDEDEREESADEGGGSSKDYRAINRKAFRESLAFLIAPGPSTGVNTEAPAPEDIHTPSTAPVEPTFAQPSSVSPQPYLGNVLRAHYYWVHQDLLKCIHYFASTYYTEMGQLRDSTREYRREKKGRKLARLQAGVAEKKKAMKAKLQNADEEEDSASDSESSPSSSSEDEQDDEPETKAKAKKGQSQGKRKRSLRRQTAYGSTDMYKICDGSALMAIGMSSSTSIMRSASD